MGGPAEQLLEFRIFKMPEPKFDIETLVGDLAGQTRSARLSSAVDNVDKIIALLTAARDQVVSAQDSHTAGITMTKLQNPIKEGFEAVNNNLKEVSKGQKSMGRALDKVCTPRVFFATQTWSR